jgi:DNA-binding Lrp family transcriptional regulator
MQARAYVLIEVEAGQIEEVIAALRSLQGIRVADVVTGPYDIIAMIELPEQRLIGRLVMDAIHGIAGLKRTITCLAIQ